MFGKDKIRQIVGENLSLLCIFVGFVLVAFSIGPYQNGDTAWELDAVSGIVRYGLPYTNGFYLMDQPPLGFYIQAFFSKIFGLSINNGTFLVTLFGLGCVALVYAIGKVVYNKTTGFFAALLFSFSAWHLILSRTFLIDVSCLFFSLFSLFVGIIAVRRNSLKLFIISGFIFAAAYITKLYAVFMLVPLVSFLIHSKKDNAKTMVGWLVAFSLPALLFSFLWYQTISGLGMTSVFSHADFLVHNLPDTVQSAFFVWNFLVMYGIGWFFVDAVVLSLLVYLVERWLFSRFLFFDVICLVVLMLIVSVDTYLGAGLNLKAPYLNAIKYNYHSLPFFSFLAATLVSKSISLFSLAKTKKSLRRFVFSFVASIGLILVGATIIYNLYYVHLFSTWEYLIFRVEPNINVGYSLFDSTSISESSLLMGIQYLGFTFTLSGLVLVCKNKLVSLLNFN